MLILKDFDYEMEQVKESPFFDLSLITVINKGKSNERSEMKLVGYSIPFENCIQRIISARLDTRDVVYSVDKYMDEYIKIANEIPHTTTKIYIEPAVEEETTEGFELPEELTEIEE